MRTLFVGWVMFLGCGGLQGVVWGQQLSGEFSLAGTAGYQSNTYLDPALGEWDPSIAPAFFAFDPSVGLSYTTPTLRVGLTGTARTYPRRIGRTLLSLTRLSGSGRYTFAPRWTVGVYGGMGRSRLQTDRNTRWILPALAWRLGSRTTLELRGGWAGQQRLLSTGGMSQQSSAIGVLQGATWLGPRLRGQVGVYLSSSHAAAREQDYGGTGFTLSTTYWWTDRLTLAGHASLEQVGYEMQERKAAGGPPISVGDGTPTTSTVTDRLWRAGVEVRWSLRPRLTLFTQVRGMIAHLASNGTSTLDSHFGVGMRWKMSTLLAGTRRMAQTRDFWRDDEAGVRFDVRYEGTGRLYVTGDFNNWAEPGVALRPTNENRYAVTLPLESGRYEYRIRILEKGTTRWLEFPDTARTVDDGFGGVNGVCIVE